MLFRGEGAAKSKVHTPLLSTWISVALGIYRLKTMNQDLENWSELAWGNRAFLRWAWQLRGTFSEKFRGNPWNTTRCLLNTELVVIKLAEVLNITVEPEDIEIDTDWDWLKWTIALEQMLFPDIVPRTREMDGSAQAPFAWPRVDPAHRLSAFLDYISFECVKVCWIPFSSLAGKASLVSMSDVILFLWS